MNSKLRIICFLTIIGIVLPLLGGCGEKKPSPKAVVAQELDYLVDNQTQSSKQKALLTQLIPAAEKNEKTDEEISKTLTLFFADFAYKITKSKITGEKANVDVDLTTIDANALAKDFISQSIVKQIQGGAAPSSVTYSANDYYHSLYTLLSSKTYPTVDSKCTIELTKTETSWQIEPEQNLGNILTGGFVDAVSNPNLFTPEDISIIYLDTIKGFDKEQMNQFLSLNNLFSAADDDKRAISQALTEQIQKCFNYNIIDSTIDGKEAQVNAEITSYDANSIIQSFSEQMGSYTSTSQALVDGISGRVTKAHAVLLDCVDKNNTTATSKVTLHLTNDGISWKLQMDATLSQAILGNIQEALNRAST